MNGRNGLAQLERSKVLGIIRIHAAEDLIRIARALHEGGLSCLEITMNTPGALEAIQKARENLPHVLMGAETVLDGITARQAILAGAQFLVTPTVKLDVLEVAHRYGVPAIIGAMTPTEILTAWEAGADQGLPSLCPRAEIPSRSPWPASPDPLGPHRRNNRR